MPDGKRKRRTLDEHRQWWYSFYRSYRFTRHMGASPVPTDYRTLSSRFTPGNH